MAKIITLLFALLLGVLVSDSVQAVSLTAPQNRAAVGNTSVPVRRDAAANRRTAPKRAGLVAFVVLATAIDLFVILSFVSCLAGPTPDWRWRWLVLLLIPLGIGRASLDWMSGQVQFQLLDILLPSATFDAAHGLVLRSVSMGFPFFAFIFWPLRTIWLDGRAAGPSEEIRG